MSMHANQWRTAATIRGLHLLETIWRRVPEEMLLPSLKKWISTGIRHADGVDFISLLAVELKRQWPRFAPNVRKRFVENMFGHNMLLAGKRRLAMFDAIGEAPVVMVISPTMRCNLKCTGCYSANYDKQDAIDTATFDRILCEAKEMGIHFIVVSGGEPYMRADLLEMFARHQDILFMTYTNGVLIYREKLAAKLAELGNVMPAISVEGFADETDVRRGKGVFNQIIGAMSALREAGVIFGFSATPMRPNNDLLVSDEFIEFYKNLGCFFGWYFNYMPVGRNPNLDLMPTIEQRAYRMDRVREIRRTHSILASDFWTDGTLTGGCLSAGRVYFHINAQGGVEPCVFHQFHVDNVLDKPLKEALNSPYFQYLRQRLYQSENPLCPCPVSDNPGILRDAVKLYRPQASQAGGTATVEDLAAGLDRYSRTLHQTMDPIWAEMKAQKGYGQGDGTMARDDRDPLDQYRDAARRRSPLPQMQVTDRDVREAMQAAHAKQRGKTETRRKRPPAVTSKKTVVRDAAKRRQSTKKP